MLKGLPEKKRKIDPKVVDSFHRYASIVILSIIAGLSGFLFWRLTALRMDFYNNLWAPAYLLVHGQNPYNTTTLHPNLPALWFPMAVGFFSPLGLLTEAVATKTWFVITVLELFTVLLLSNHDRLKFHEITIIGFLVFLFPPLLNHIALGQLSITIMLCLMLSAYFADKRKDWMTAFFLALGLAKPQLGTLALAGLSFYYFKQGGAKLVFRLGTQTLFMALLMSLPLFIAYPQWIPAWMDSLRSNFSWLHPSVFSILKQSIGAWGYFFWGITVLAGLAICYQLWTKLPPLEAMMWNLGLTTLITPYLWSWDFVLLLPVWAFTFSHVDWKSKIFLFGTYWLGWLGLAFVQHLPSSSNDMSWWFPLWFMSTVTLVALWKARRPNFIVWNDAPNSRL